MEVIPVIDLKRGQVVHARAGNRAEYRPIRTPLSATSAPEDVAGGLLRLFAFRRLYIADLDAIAGGDANESVLLSLAARYPELELWVDHGAADLRASAWLARGVGHLVIGSESQTGPDLVRTLRAHPRVLLSLDFRGNTFLGPESLVSDPELWPERVIVMSLARVGAEQGPDLERLADIRRRAAGRRIYAAGGVRNGDDLARLADAECAGALVATALHSGAITGREIGALARH